MHRQFIRIFFIALIPLLCLQTVLVRKYGEPFPSVRFPGFGSILSASYPFQFKAMNVVLFSETDSVQMTLNELLDPTPQYAKVFFFNISGKLKQLPPYVAYRTTEKPVREVLDFFRAKAQQNTSLDSLTQLELRWYQHEVSTPQATPTAVLLEKKTLAY